MPASRRDETTKIIHRRPFQTGVPLGGLGTGSVELRPDGFLHEWQIMNNRPWGAGPPVDLPLETCYFALQVTGRGLHRTGLLGIPRNFSLHLNDPFHLPWLEQPETIEDEVRVPFSTLRYRFERFPVEVALEAFSPLIPLNAKDSGLPVAFFTFSLRNRTRRALRISLFGALKNLVGYTQPDYSSTMTFERRGRLAALRFGREGLPQHDSARGEMALGSWTDGRSRATYVLHPRTVRDVWDPLRATGRLEDRDFGTFEGVVGDEMPERLRVQVRRGLPYGVLCRTLDLAPRGTAEVTFCLAWHFPEMHERPACPDKAPERIGHMYENWFADAGEALAYAHRHHARLRAASRRFVEAFYASRFPRWLLDAVNAQLTTLVKSSWWDRRGRFGIWEGLGCCGLQTTDITHYASFPIVLFFPEVQQSQMRLSVANIPERGKIPHMMPGAFACCDADPKNRIDLIPQFVLLVWRDVLWTGDRRYAREMWPVVRDALEFARRFDTDGDGIPNNQGPDQTYDQFPLRGSSAYCGFLYAAAFHAGADLARRLGETDDADRLARRCRDALSTLDAQLWNGEYYRLCHDPTDGADDEGVMIDQVNGDWFVRQTTGAPLLPPAKVRSALRSILRYCATPPGYLVTCAWPHGGGVTIPRTTSDQVNCPFSGVEYSVAAHLVMLGREREGLRLARNVWERHERQGMRFNHIECGEHYYRALAVWALYLALTGFHLDALEGEAAFRLRPGGRWLFNTPAGWGTMETGESGRRLRMTVAEGRLRLKAIRLGGASASAARVAVGRRRVACRCEAVPGGVRVVFERMLHLRAGERLTVTLA